jgi:putative DNA primase/helicase
LVELAEITHSVALGITHFSKNTAGKHPLERVTGSHAFGAAARVVIACAKTENLDRILVRVKNNLGPDGGGFAWGNVLHGEARELLEQAESAADKKEDDEVVEWLKATLEATPKGEMSRVEIMKAGKAESFSASAITRARKRGKFRTARFGFPAVAVWRLPWSAPTPAEESVDGEKF